MGFGERRTCPVCLRSVGVRPGRHTEWVVTAHKLLGKPRSRVPREECRGTGLPPVVITIGFSP